MAGKKTFIPEQALEKAMNLFWNLGYEGTSIEDLVRSTGIGRGSLYDTFGDKHALYCALFKEPTIAALQQSGSLQEILEHLFQVFIDMLIDDPARRGCFLVNSTIELAGHDSEVFKKTQSAYSDLEEVFYSILTKAQVAGEFAPTSDPHQFARFLLGTLISIRVLARAKADRNTLQDIAKTALLALR
jgi:TetR/AcrR family transcriptional regulator, transcriptional repressor for nem operon